MLVKIEVGKDIFELNPWLKGIEEFERLTPRQMTYVAFATDYMGPFRLLPPDQRRTQAAVSAGYKYEKDGTRLDTNARNLVDGKVGNVEAAIKKYATTQFDEYYESLLSVKALIAQIREFNNKPDKTADELKKAVDMTVGKLDKLIETAKNIEELIGMREREQSPVDQEGNQVGQGGSEDEFNIDNLSLLAKINEGLV